MRQVKRLTKQNIKHFAKWGPFPVRLNSQEHRGAVRVLEGKVLGGVPVITIAKVLWGESVLGLGGTLELCGGFDRSMTKLVSAMEKWDGIVGMVFVLVLGTTSALKELSNKAEFYLQKKYDRLSFSFLCVDPSASKLWILSHLEQLPNDKDIVRELGSAKGKEEE